MLLVVMGRKVKRPYVDISINPLESVRKIFVNKSQMICGV